MKKYFSIGKINFLNNINYFGEFFFKSVFILLILFIFANLWKVIFAGGNALPGYTVAMMVWYMLMTESIVTSSPNNVREINQDIQSGEIAYKLNKPYNYVFYYLAKSLSYSIIGFFVTFLIGGILVYFLVGGISFNLVNTGFLIISVLLAMVLSFVMMTCISLLAFWFEDTNSLKWIYDKILFTVGGMLVPLEVFPLWLAKISEVLPFSFVAYYPARLFVNFNLMDFLRVTGIQLVYIGVFLIIALVIYKAGIRRVNINGG